MADTMTNKQRSECMSRIHSKDTGPELAVRRELWRRGYRFRINVRTLPGTPDIVLPRYRTAIFINGCFWHGHKGCKLYTVPKTNVEFWTEKVRRNKERDMINIQRLESLSWNVITIWECELKHKTFIGTIGKVEYILAENQRKWETYKDRRRQDRLFSREQSRSHREILAQVKAELEAQFHHEVRLSKIPRQYE